MHIVRHNGESADFLPRNASPVQCYLITTIDSIHLMIIDTLGSEDENTETRVYTLFADGAKILDIL